MHQTIQESIMLAAMEGDLPHLLELGRECLGRPLLLGGELLEVLGWSGPPVMPEDAVWEDFIQAGLAPAFRMPEELFQSNWLDLPHGFTACQVNDGDGGVYWIMDIEMSGMQPLHLILPEREKDALPLPDARLLGLTCLAVRNCVNNRLRVEPYRPYSAEQFLLQLIRNEKIDEPVLRFRANSVGMESEGYFSLLMLDLRGYHPHRNSIAAVRAQLSALLGDRSVIDGEVMTFLVSHATGEEAEKRQLWERVEPILEENQLFGVLGFPIYRMGEFREQYIRTLDTLKLRFCADPGRHLVYSEDLGLYAIIAELRERETLDMPVPQIIRTLLASDQTRKTGYVDTLTSFLRHTQKHVPTCEELHIHRNTLDYRLRRIQELTGLDWSDGDLMFRLYFSLCVMRYDRLAGNRPGLL